MNDMEEMSEYEKKCEQYKKVNEQYLEWFRQDLEEKGLKPKNIKNHIENMDLYLNDYLLYEDAYSMEQGIDMVNGFLGYWFIRKCLWSTPDTVRSCSASIKKFYKSMLARGKVSQDAYDMLVFTIKNDLEDWMDSCY